MEKQSTDTTNLNVRNDTTLSIRQGAPRDDMDRWKENGGVSYFSLKNEYRKGKKMVLFAATSRSLGLSLTAKELCKTIVSEVRS